MNNQKLENGLYARIDWLEFTVTELDSEKSSRDNAYRILNLFGLHSDLFDEQGKGGLGYKDSLRHLYENIFVYFNGSSEMGVHFRVSGTSVTYVLKSFLETFATDTPFGKGYELDPNKNNEFRVSIRKALGAYEESEYDDYNILALYFQRVLDIGHFTRIDLALDDVGAEYFTVNDVFHFVDDGLVSCRFKKWQNVKGASFSGDCTGHTVYFGSRESDVFLRVYEKAYEQGIKDISWTRWELEIKHEKADLVANEIIKNPCFGSVAMGILSSYVRIIQKDNDNVSRCSIHPTWSKFVDNAKRLRLRLPEKRTSIQQKIDWIDKQCMPTLAGIILSNGGDISFLRDNLESHFDRLKEKDKKMFKDALGGVDNDGESVYR